MKCWQSTQANDSHRVENLAVFKAAYADYQRQVSPWLEIICDTYRGNTPVIMKARNAAAECLNSLAGGFICLNDFDTAQALTLKALPLVLDNDKLEAEIKGQLNYIAAEKEKSVKSAPSPAPSADTQHPVGATAGGNRKDSASGLERAAPSILHSFGGSRVRFPLIVALGIGLLIAIPFLITDVTGPEWHPSVAALTVGKTGATVEPQTPGDSQPLPESASSPTREVRPIPTYERIAPVAPPKYEAAPLLREVKPVPDAEIAHEPVSLPNGTNLIPPQDSEGLGKLRISNYTGSDAAVKLKTSVGKTTVRFVYVRAMSDVTVSKIVPGEYVLQFATGRDWDANDLAFRRVRAFAVFDKALSFSERQVEDGTVYSTHEITLHAVPNGNIRKKTISPEEFTDDVGTGGNRRPQR